MTQELTLRIVLESPPPGVDFALQKGSGNNYEVVQKQRSANKDLLFELKIGVRENKSSDFTFAGPFVQGPPQERFIYIDIGTSAGQIDSVWTRRLKVPLRGITQAIIKRLLTNSSLVLQTKVPGTAKDGGPNCATVKPFPGWEVV